MLILKRPWTRQPKTAVSIDRSNPITSGLNSVIVPSLGAVDLVSTTAPVVVGATRQISRAGVGFKGLGESYNGYVTTAMHPGGDYTVLVVGVRHSLPWHESTYLYSAGEDSAGVGRIHLWAGVAGFGTLNQFFHSSQLISGNGRTVPLPDQYTVTNFVVADQEPFAFAVSGSGMSVQMGPDLLIIRRTDSGGTRYSSGCGIYLCAQWTRKLSQAELNAVTAAPWQLFAPRRTYLPLSGIAIPTLSALSPTVNNTPRYTITF